MGALAFLLLAAGSGAMSAAPVREPGRELLARREAALRDPEGSNLPWETARLHDPILERLLERLCAGEAEAASLAARRVHAMGGDAWILADDLLGQGCGDAARRLAEAAVLQPRELLAALAIEGARGTPEARAALADVAACRHGPAGVSPSEEVGPVLDGGPSILAARLAAAGALALEDQPQAAARAWARAACLAAELGWREGEQSAWQAAAARSEAAFDARAARSHLSRVVRGLRAGSEALRLRAMLRLARWTGREGDLPGALGLLEEGLRHAAAAGEPALLAGYERERARWLGASGALGVAADALASARRWSARASPDALAALERAGAAAAWEVEAEHALALGDAESARQALGSPRTREDAPIDPVRRSLALEQARLDAQLAPDEALPALVEALRVLSTERPAPEAARRGDEGLLLLAAARAWATCARLTRGPEVATAERAARRWAAAAETVLSLHGWAGAALEARALRASGMTLSPREAAALRVEAERLRLGPLALTQRVTEARGALARGDADAAVEHALRAFADLDRLGDGLSAAARARLHGSFAEVGAVALETAVSARPEQAQSAELWLRLLGGRQAQALGHAVGSRPLRASRAEGHAPRASADVEAARQRAYTALLAAQSAGDVSEQGRRRVEAASAAFARQLRAQRESLAQRERKQLAGGSSDSLRPLPPTLDGLRAALLPEEACVAFAVHKEGVWALRVARGDVELLRLVEGQEMTAALLRDVETLARPAPRGGGPQAQGAEAEALVGRLRATLLAPLRLPTEIARLHVVPDPRLACLPWAWVAGLEAPWSLVLRPGLGLERPIQAGLALEGQGTVALGAPAYPDRLAGGPIAALRSSAAGPGTVLPALLPLPWTEAEARAAASRAGDRLLLGEGATEDLFWAALAARGPWHRWRCVHLAAHGWVDDRHPAEAMLALAPSADHDGLLTMAEVGSGRIDADMVVLSACRSGRGRALAGEGLLGLTRAFLEAGASRVVASLWDVPDRATQRLMRAFHEGLDAGHAPPEALRDAQRTVAREHPETAAWAGWVLWALSEPLPVVFR